MTHYFGTFLPLITSVIIFLTTFSAYFLYAIYQPQPQMFHLSLLLRLHCEPITALTFVPNILVFGYTIATVILFLVFGIKFLAEREHNFWAKLRLVVGITALLAFIAMYSFRSGRGVPFDLIHQISAGLAVFFFLVYALLCVYQPTKSRKERRLSFIASLIAALIMLVTYFVAVQQETLILAWNLFALAQLLFALMYFSFVLTLSTDLS